MTKTKPLVKAFCLLALVLPTAVALAQSQQSTPSSRWIPVSNGQYIKVISGTFRGTDPDNPEMDARNKLYIDNLNEGDKLLEQGDASDALVKYQAAIDADAGPDMDGKLRQGRAYFMLGQYAKAVDIYRSRLCDRNGQENVRLGNYGYPRDWMCFAVALQKTGQKDEAISMYNIGAYAFNYDDGRQRHDILIPSFGNAAGQAAYDSSILEAGAYDVFAGDAESFQWDNKQALRYARQAVQFAPKAAFAWYFLSDAEAVMSVYGATPDSKAAMLKAIALDGNGPIAAKGRENEADWIKYGY